MPKAPKRIYDPENPFTASVVTRKDPYVRIERFATLEKATAFVVLHVPTEGDEFAAFTITSIRDGIVTVLDRGDNADLVSCRH